MAAKERAVICATTDGSRGRPGYKVVCISLYDEDVERLADLVATLRARGHTGASKSAVIRYALGCVDPAAVPAMRRRRRRKR